MFRSIQVFNSSVPAHELSPPWPALGSSVDTPGQIRDVQGKHSAPALPEGVASGHGVNAGDPGRRPCQQWLLWQLADSAFPGGGFAHSGGLEAALQHGELITPTDMRGFIEASLRQAGHASLPFVLATFDAPDRLAEIDGLCDGFLTNHVANRASRLQGQALLASAESIFATPRLMNLRESGVAAVPYGHLAPIFGALIRDLQIERADASRLFMYWHLRGLVSAGVRLGLVGPLQGQTLHWSLAEVAETVGLRCQGLTIDEIAQTAPLLEQWQANQDRLYSRLFQS